MASDRRPIRVLHVDDEPRFAEMAGTFLEREDDRFDVETATDADEGMDRLLEADFDCVVSDYDMPGRNGIEFLESVRDRFPDLPFVLFTGKGSEEVASEAISAGVTDYLQKGTGTEQYELLATRIANAVGQHRTERELERQNDLFEKAQNIADVGAWEYDAVEESVYTTDEVNRIHGLPPGPDPEPETSMEHYHEEDRPEIRRAFTRALEDGEPYDLELRLVTADGDLRWVRTRGEPQSEDGEIVRVRGTIQDITERKQRERNLRRQNERFEEFAHVVSHDVRSPLQVAMGQLEVARRTGDEEAFRDVREAHERIDQLTEDVLTLARQGRRIGDTERVRIDRVAREALETVDSSGLTLRTVGDLEVTADPDGLRQLFENLFANAAEHGGEGVTVSVGPIDPFPTTTRGTTDDSYGLYVADDGQGIPEAERDEVFDAGYSTADEGTGFGLSIVERIVEAHDWEITLTRAQGGGARFEVTGVDVIG